MENQTSEETQEETQTEPKKETQEKPSEETSEETVKKETSKTPETVDYEEKFKASQTEAIRLKKENDDFRKAKSSNPVGINVDEILEIQSATKGLDSEEISELKLRSNATGKSLTEARKDENFEMWQKAHKEKVEKDNAPEPSTKQGGSERTKSLSEMSLDEKGDYFAKQGFTKPFPKAKPL